MESVSLSSQSLVCNRVLSFSLGLGDKSSPSGINSGSAPFVTEEFSMNLVNECQELCVQDQPGTLTQQQLLDDEAVGCAVISSASLRTLSLLPKRGEVRVTLGDESSPLHRLTPPAGTCRGSLTPHGCAMESSSTL